MIVIIDSGMGNFGSVANMLKKVGAEAIISSSASTIEEADKLILPGVGSFDSAMKSMKERNLIPVLTYKVLKQKTPILGICLGLQLFTERSEEGQLSGLNWLKAETVRFRVEKLNPCLKIPHMGWNTLRKVRAHPLLTDMDHDLRFYFVHSHHVVCRDEDLVVAHSDYGYPFASVVAHENILGVQFHPEKSHKFGMRLFQNFVRLTEYA
jgi:glutamine amidotransferase